MLRGMLRGRRSASHTIRASPRSRAARVALRRAETYEYDAGQGRTAVALELRIPSRRLPACRRVRAPRLNDLAACFIAGFELARCAC